jgi:hypothetical protein
MPGMAATGIFENAGAMNCLPVRINDSEVLVSHYESVRVIAYLMQQVRQLSHQFSFPLLQ